MLAIHICQTLNHWNIFNSRSPRHKFAGRGPTNDLSIIQIIQNFLLVGIVTASILTPYSPWNSSSLQLLPESAASMLADLSAFWRKIWEILWPHYIFRPYVNTHLSNASFKKADQEIDGMGSRPTQFIVVKSAWIAMSLQPSNPLRVSSCSGSFLLVHSLITILNRDWNPCYLPKLGAAEAHLRYCCSSVNYTGSVV